ncbi:MAG: hypothetical protein ACRD2O_05650 [Terriglobia bacterium]
MSTQRRRRDDKLDWEEMENAPNVEGMLSYLRAPASASLPSELHGRESLERKVLPGSSLGRKKFRLRRCTEPRDAHTPGEQALLDAFYRLAKDPRWGRLQTDGSFLVSVPLTELAEEAALHETNVRSNLRGLIRKLALEILRPENQKLQSPREYRVYNGGQIMDRRRAAGLEWVIKTRGVTFVSAERGTGITT